VELGDLLPARWAGTLAQPWGDAEIARQLDDAKQHIAAAIPTQFFAAFVDGEIAAFCEIRSDGRTAQIEDVEVVERFRGRGLGRAIVQHALGEARRSHDVVWLEALADDWPRELYAKLGFELVDRRDLYTQFPHPLTRLRLTTPRLELRLATVAELRRLFAVAAAGIHDPGKMPFAVPWTDNLDEDDFVKFHLDKPLAATPDNWHLALVAFVDGEPAGVQGIGAEHFATERSVETGSWLGKGFQGKGLGTEMRAAVLELAFTGLHAERAVSGAIAGNPQSLGVSRKLGYDIVGAHSVSPRGEPVDHTDVVLGRERFRSPVPVEISGLEPVLPLLGASA
jgi:RimJ/RimL family protein N-acetyltransferase/predicted GNAT family acetyltransferase